MLHGGTLLPLYSNVRLSLLGKSFCVSVHKDRRPHLAVFSVRSLSTLRLFKFFIKKQQSEDFI